VLNSMAFYQVAPTRNTFLQVSNIHRYALNTF
jgi:hypothetical protein